MTRAGITTESIKKYFQNLQEMLLNVEPHNIYNYDEIIVLNDQGKIKDCLQEE